MIMSYTYTNITAHPFENKHIKKIIDRIIRQLSENKEGRLWICDPFSNNKTNRLQGTELITNECYMRDVWI